MIFSCVIPCSANDLKSQKLKDLIDSIKEQDFPQDQIEIIVVTNFESPLTETLHHNLKGIKLYFSIGDSEQAKAEGIRVSKGDICVMLCADNEFSLPYVFSFVKEIFDKHKEIDGAYSKHYNAYQGSSLNRYFSLIGANDVIAYYLNKADRLSAFNYDFDELYSILNFTSKIPSLGCNGTFVRRSIFKDLDLNNYYPMDIWQDLVKKRDITLARMNRYPMIHKTSDNLISFLIKRYKYAKDLYSDRTNRRWRMLDTREDYLRLCWFIFATITIIQPLMVSIKGFSKIRDWAWFWHWPVCFGFLITYTLLAIRNLFKHGRLFQRGNL